MSDADQWAEEQVQKVEATLGPLSPAARAQLLAQHRAYYPAHRQKNIIMLAGAAVVVLWFLTSKR